VGGRVLLGPITVVLYLYIHLHPTSGILVKLISIPSLLVVPLPVVHAASPLSPRLCVAHYPLSS